jgi:release factor glutamine methyltransferase
LRTLRADATRRLADAGVASPQVDAELLLAFSLGVPRGRLAIAAEPNAEQQQAFDQLVERRARREPLQHLTGRAPFRRLDLRVGPGVFVPRPETELLTGWAIEHTSTGSDLVVVDLCTGSGAIAAAVASEVPAEARLFDPPVALWSGDDGLDTIRVVARVAARLLRPGGVVGCEHADAQGDSAPAVFRDGDSWSDITDHRDLAGRPRFVTARRR